MYIVTGASDNHFQSLCQFLRSIPTHMLEKTYVWNLGLTEENQKILASEFHTTIKRVFPYHEYPSYFNIDIAAGEYAWKPVIILKTAEELQNNPQVLLWSDAGNIQYGTFDRVESVIKSQGIYTPTSTGSIRYWTHPECLKYFRISPTDPILNLRPREGAIVGFDLTQQSAFNLLKEWARLAQIKECIAPEGSNRDNHRQDQAVLSILYYKFTNNQYLEQSEINMATHQDCDWRFKN